jgi:hypothetical protein
MNKTYGKVMHSRGISSGRRDRVKKTFFHWMAAFPVLPFGVLLSGLVLSACTMITGDLYPRTVQELEYMGKAAKLTSNSSNLAFFDGLDEVTQAYEDAYPDSSAYTFDGITYEITDPQSTSRIPDLIWELYWANLDKERYSTAYCWKFMYRQIPSKGGSGTAYILWTIVTNTSDVEVLYRAAKGVVSPRASPSPSTPSS